MFENFLGKAAEIVVKGAEAIKTGAEKVKEAQENANKNCGFGNISQSF